MTMYNQPCATAIPNRENVTVETAANGHPQFKTKTNTPDDAGSDAVLKVDQALTQGNHRRIKYRTQYCIKFRIGLGGSDTCVASERWLGARL